MINFMVGFVVGGLIVAVVLGGLNVTDRRINSRRHWLGPRK